MLFDECVWCGCLFSGMVGGGVRVFGREVGGFEGVGTGWEMWEVWEVDRSRLGQMLI